MSSIELKEEGRKNDAARRISAVLLLLPFFQLLHAPSSSPQSRSSIVWLSAYRAPSSPFLSLYEQRQLALSLTSTSQLVLSPPSREKPPKQKRARKDQSKSIHQQEVDPFVCMDPRHVEDALKHLEKQHELLTKSHSAMTQELQTLQVEEQMLMEKFYELMTAHGLNKKDKEGQNVCEGKQMVLASSSAIVTGNKRQ